MAQAASHEIDAQDLREARNKIRLLGFVPTKVYIEGEFTQNNLKLNRRVNFLSLMQKISFTSELATLLSAGIPILEALHSIETNTPDLKIKFLASDIQNAVKSGMTFAQSVENLYGDVFGAVFVSLVKSGEESGELDLTLDRMLTLLRKQDNIKGKIISASIYPAILILMMFGILILFSKFVFPAFMGIITMNGGSLPPLAGFLTGLFSFVNNFWWLILLGIGAFGFLCNLFVKNESIKSKWDNFILKIPVISDFIEYINLSNFMTVLHISYEAGVPLVSGLELAKETIGNTNIKNKIHQSSLLTKSGKTLTDSFQQTNAIPFALMSMISAGEKSGTLGKMFHDAAEIIDKKVDLTLEALTKLFEPAVIIILGGFVLIMVLAFFQAYIGALGTLF